MMMQKVGLRNTLKVFRGLYHFDALSQVILPQLKLYKTISFGPDNTSSDLFYQCVTFATKN